MSVATAAALITEILSREQAAKDARVEITLEVRVCVVGWRAGADEKGNAFEAAAQPALVSSLDCVALLCICIFFVNIFVF